MKLFRQPAAWALFVGVVLIGTLITGCGNDPKTGGTAGTEGAASPTAAVGTGTGSGSGFSDLVLKIGRIPFTNATEMVIKHEGLLKYLQKELGVKEVRLVLASDYEGILKKIGRNEIDIGWLGSIPYAEGRDKFQLKPLVKPVRFKTQSYRGIIITRQDSGIKSLRDLKGKRFAWVEKDSASGYIFPRALLAEAKISPDRDFQESEFLKKHDAVVLNVLLGKYDAGACYDDARQTLKDKDKINELTILATTQDIANEPIVCREDFPAELAEKVKTALLKLSLSNPLHRKYLEDCTDVQGFVPAIDSDYDYIRQVLKILQTQ
jgi:phosphonate transport system substrate-binding protein